MNVRPRLVPCVLAGAALLAFAGCATRPPEGMAPVAVVPHVDLPRYMGDWYVIATIPTFFEKGEHNAKEHYELAPDGTIPTTFTFNKDAPDGPLKTVHSKATVEPGTGNAVWGEEYVPPLKADYRIAWLAPDYSQVVVAREKRDYVWIMARTPTIPAADYDRRVAFVASLGYDMSKLVRVPQPGMR